MILSAPCSSAGGGTRTVAAGTTGKAEKAGQEDGTDYGNTPNHDCPLPAGTLQWAYRVITLLEGTSRLKNHRDKLRNFLRRPIDRNGPSLWHSLVLFHHAVAETDDAPRVLGHVPLVGHNDDGIALPVETIKEV